MRNHHQSIPDRSRPGLPTTASGVAQQGTCGNYTTAKHCESESRKGGGGRVRGQREAWKGGCSLIRVGTLNIGAMTGGGESWRIWWSEEMWTYCVYRKQGGKGVKRGTLEVDAGYSTAELTEEGMG